MARPRRSSGWTYARAGVDRNSVARSLRGLLSQVRYRASERSGRPLALPGHYAGLIRVGHETIAVTTDTVGTKSLLARRPRDWEAIGEDAVMVNVNDLASVGARPFGFVDCILCDRPVPATFEALGRGINRGLRRADCSLLGGETAVVPDVVRGIDVGGTAMGFFPGGRRPVTGEQIRPGDTVLGLDSDGFHANGFTLVRRLLADPADRWPLRIPGERRAFRTALLAPTRSYVAASESIASYPGVVGLAHVSGGGVRNLVRLNGSVRFRLDGWPLPSGLFAWVAEAGHLRAEELYQTFNTGIGFVVVVRARNAAGAMGRLRSAGYPDVRPIGEVVTGRGVELPGAGLEFANYA